MPKANKLNTPPIPVLRKLIDDEGVKRAELAKYLGVSDAAIGQYYNGETLPTMEKLMKLADFFQVSTDYLLGRTDIKSVDLTEKAICKYTGLTEKALFAITNMHKICKEKIYSHTTPFQCLINLLSSTYITRICNLLAIYLCERAEQYCTIEETRRITKIHIKEELQNDIGYDFYSDNRYQDLLTNEDVEREMLEFLEWKLSKNIQNIIEEFVSDEEELIKPELLCDDIDDFIKECLENGNRPETR